MVVISSYPSSLQDSGYKAFSMFTSMDQKENLWTSSSKDELEGVIVHILKGLIILKKTNRSSKSRVTRGDIR